MEKKIKRPRWDNEATDDLISALLLLKNRQEAKKFLRDLLTEVELIELGKRWKIVQMLDRGDSYAVIEKETHMSSRTIARVHRWMKKGVSSGGYELMLKRTRKN